MSRTIREAHQWASSFLQQHERKPAGEAHFTAEVLLRHLLGWDRARFFAYRDEMLHSRLWEELQHMIEQKCQGVPLQHLVGSQEFYGRAYQVTPDVLIPRPETEGLVEEVLKQSDTLWGDQLCSVVDVGTGSGAIAVTLAAERSAWRITAVDLSETALQVARENAVRHKAEQRIRFLQGDLLTPLIARGERVDIVVSNPPYIPTREIETLAVEVREHEPALALDGGEDGLDAYRRIAEMLPRVTKKHKGLVAVEVGIGQSEQVADLLKRVLPRGDVRIIPDLAGIARVVSVIWC